MQQAAAAEGAPPEEVGGMGVGVEGVGWVSVRGQGRNAKGGARGSGAIDREGEGDGRGRRGARVRRGRRRGLGGVRVWCGWPGGWQRRRRAARAARATGTSTLIVFTKTDGNQ